ncbi:hypothetical protein BH10CYA1_BH10CYA1_48410 [soil metagenome]
MSSNSFEQNQFCSENQNSEKRLSFNDVGLSCRQNADLSGRSTQIQDCRALVNCGVLPIFGLSNGQDANNSSRRNISQDTDCPPGNSRQNVTHAPGRISRQDADCLPGTSSQKPEVQKQQEGQTLSDQLTSKTATTDQKLHAIEKLVAEGKTHVELRTSDGRSVAVRLEVEKIGNRHMVHMFANDASGKELTVLRGISKGDGYERERDKHGNFVSFEGKGASLLTHGKSHGDKNSSEATAKPVIQENHTPSSTQCRETATARGTAYYPYNNALEGGFKDKSGKPLCTLQDYLTGKAPYVSVAMDDQAGICYGQKLNIPELNAKYNRKIEFRVVDTGGAFRGKGKNRIDICVASADHANDSVINGNLTLQFI